MDEKHLGEVYDRISGDLDRVAAAIEANLTEVFGGVSHIDRITCRVKARESFLVKATKNQADGRMKYAQPFKQVQDFIGCRIIVYYKSDIKPVTELVDKFYRRIEHQHIVPDDTSTFGYEGTHVICSIPSNMYATTKLESFPDFFELQIKTLFQHAWSQSQHGLGYKPGTTLSDEEKRKLAFIAAQSWGADTLLNEISHAQSGGVDEKSFLVSEV